MRAIETWGRGGLAAALLAIPLAGTLAAVLWPGLIPASAGALTGSLRHAGTAGMALAITAQVLIAASGILPASLVGLAAGALYGVALGGVMAAGSTLAGAVLTFAVSRSLFRSVVARLLPSRPRLRNLDGLVAREGWKLVCLLRVSPVMPFAATSYALGLTSIPTLPYVVGTLAALPALIGYVVLGSVAGAMTDAWRQGLGTTRIALLAVGLAATALITLRIGQLLCRAMRGLEGDALQEFGTTPPD